MKQNLNLFIHDIKGIFTDKKTIILIFFLTLLTVIICISFCFIVKLGNESLLNQLESISGIKDQNLFISFIINIYSFLFFTAFPFILGIVIISYLKEFGELELMMLFPINRKFFFIEKVLCIFSISLLFCWASILINSLIQSAVMNVSFYFSKYKLLYALIVLPVWLFFISCLTVLISASSKDSKSANQKSLILPFILITGVQLLLYMKVNVFSYTVVFLPLLIGLIGAFILLIVLNRKFSIEKIIYN